MEIRDVRRGDLDAVVEIYEHSVRSGVANCDLADHSLRSREARDAWLQAHEGPYQAFVADVDGYVAGWSCLSPYDGRPCFVAAAYTSTYVHSDMRGRGIGRALRVHLIDHATKAGMVTLISRVFARNSASLHLTESLGFRRVGTLHQVVNRDGEYWDAVLYELVLGAAKPGLPGGPVSRIAGGPGVTAGMPLGGS